MAINSSTLGIEGTAQLVYACAKKLMDEVAPKFADKNGGYTRIIKTGPRRGDAAEMCIIELIND